MARPPRSKLLKLIDDLVDVGVPVLAGLELDADAARAAMLQIARALCYRNAKTTIYVPEAMEFELTERDAKIWDDYQKDGPEGARKFSGHRVEQLAAAHNLTVQQVYNILRQCRLREVSERQGKLPGIADA